MKFEKKPITIEQQLDQFAARGMEIPNPDTTRFYLTHIGYYRLRGYWMSLETTPSANGAHAYLKSDLFQGHRQYGRSLAEIASEFERSKEHYIRHCKRKYNEPDLPPIWAIVGIMKLGQFTHWLSSLKRKSTKARIAKAYGLDEGVLASFLRQLMVTRNTCVHHGRLWNSELTLTMQLPRTKPPVLTGCFDFGPDPNQAPRRLYSTLVMLAYLMDVISPGNKWKHRLKTFLEQHGIMTRQMGFPEDFASRPIWSAVWQETA